MCVEVVEDGDGAAEDGDDGTVGRGLLAADASEVDDDAVVAVFGVVDVGTVI